MVAIFPEPDLGIGHDDNSGIENVSFNSFLLELVKCFLKIITGPNQSSSLKKKNKSSEVFDIRWTFPGFLSFILVFNSSTGIVLTAVQAARSSMLFWRTHWIFWVTEGHPVLCSGQSKDDLLFQEIFPFHLDMSHALPTECVEIKEAAKRDKALKAGATIVYQPLERSAHPFI